MAKQDPSAVDAYAACFIDCLVGDDKFDDVFRNNYHFILEHGEHEAVGLQLLPLLDSESAPKADVAYAKILFFPERARGKLTRREIAFSGFQSSVCEQRRRMKATHKSVFPPMASCGRYADKSKHPFPGRNSIFYALEQRPELLTPDQFAAIKAAYVTQHQDDFSPEIVDRLVGAAKRKDVGAQFLLSAALEMGVGVDVDLIESRAWLELAVSQNPPYGKQLIERASVLLDDEGTVKAMGRAAELRRQFTNLYDNPATVIIGDGVTEEE